MLIAYRKVSDDYTTYQLALPEPVDGEPQAQEIANLPDGRTVVALAEGAVLPADQPPQIAGSIQTVDSPTPAQLEAIRRNSPHARTAWVLGMDRFRRQWDESEEQVVLRIAVGKLLGLYVPTARENSLIDKYFADLSDMAAWVRQRLAQIGL